MTKGEAQALLDDWRFWARPNQIAPDGDWATWLILAGRGFGKTHAGANWVKERQEAGARSIALVAETTKDLEEVMVPRLLSLYRPEDAPTVRFRPVRLVWPSGALALGYNGTEPDQLRGPEFDTAWVDELAKYSRAETMWDMLQFTMRAGDDPRVCVTTTPRAIPLIRNLAKASSTVVTVGSTFDNASNLPTDFLQRVRDRYEGTRLGRQELYAEILDDVPGALWWADLFQPIRDLPPCSRIVVAVDPSGIKADEDEGDSQGLVVAGRLRSPDEQGRSRFVIIEDATCRLSPAGWGRLAVQRYHHFKADVIVAERNFGGEMVASTIRTADRNAKVKLVTASRGKTVRAEPIAALYEQKRVFHLPGLGDLENQMMHFTTTGYVGEGSPDRVDAAVWALSELSEGSTYDLMGLV